MSTPDPVQIRPWHPGDEAGIARLFERAFGKSISVEHWMWKLRPRPPPFENVWIGCSNGQPVFQYAGMPIRFKLGHEVVPAVVSVDTMTAPEFRRRGLLTRAAGEAYAAWRERGAAFVIGLPNENWGSRARALGWLPLFPLQWLIRPLRPEVVLRRRLGWEVLARLEFLGTLWNAAFDRRLRPSPDVQVEAAAEVGREFDEIWDGARGGADFCTVRDRSWVDWRFFACPSRSYKVAVARRRRIPCGYVCQAVMGSGLRTSAYLADLQCARSDLQARDALLAYAIAEARRGGAASLHALAVPGSAEFSALRRLGFFPRREFRVEIVPLRAGLPLDRLRDPARWHLTGSDFDVV
jgi:hypothetical protein